MQILTKLLFGMFLVTIVTITTGFSRAPQQPLPEQKHFKPGDPWSGGKPRPPISIKAPAVMPIAPDSTQEVTFTLSPDIDCENIKYQIHGLNGVKVLKESRKGKLECTAGTPTEITALVHVPAHTAGSVVLTASMQKDGKILSTTRSIAVTSTDIAATEKEKHSQARKSGISGEETYQVEPADTSSH